MSVVELFVVAAAAVVVVAAFLEDNAFTRTAHFSHTTVALPFLSPFKTIAFASSNKNEEKHWMYSFALEKRKGIGFNEEEGVLVTVFLAVLLC